ncbi:MAG: helical backbone metal receptor [Desulfuromonadaceae bacterium]|nr:helical backbone metal receptor [Desulfuromonadaceae bacterium]MDD5107431.1 helical backbone metal receptor [Desulfuromonadaceae bacterium]
MHAGLRLNRLLLIVFVMAVTVGVPIAHAEAKTPQRIISLAPAVTEILFSAGLENRVAGVTNVCDRPAAARKKARVGAMANPSLEAIVALKPDLVILANKENPKELAGRLTGLGIRTHVFKTTDLDELPAELRTVGRLTGAEYALGKMAKNIETSIRNTRLRLQQKGAPTGKKVLFVVWPNPLVVAGSGTLIDDAVTKFGLKNIAAGSGMPYPRLSLETIIGSRPDLIIFGAGHTDMKEGSKVLLKRLGMLDAVRKGRVCYMKDDALYRPGPRITDGFAELAQCVDML